MALDCISKHRARHLPIVLSQERVFGPAVALSNLSQHPPDSFVDQVVWVLQKKSRNTQRRTEFIALDEMKCRDDRDSSLPDVARLGEPLEQLHLLRAKMRTDDMLGRGID